jgi:hypothetical protein
VSVHKRTPERIAAIIAGIEGGLGIHEAAKAAGVAPCTLHLWQKSDPEFAGQVHSAKFRSKPPPVKRPAYRKRLPAPAVAKTKPTPKPTATIDREGRAVRDLRPKVTPEAAEDAILDATVAANRALGGNPRIDVPLEAWRALRPVYSALGDVDRRNALLRMLADETSRIRAERGTSMNRVSHELVPKGYVPPATGGA